MLAARSRLGWNAVVGFIDHRWPGPRTSVVARTQVIDELIAANVHSARQVVILGAGFDSRAWRLACLRDVDVFEVDHPDTQRKKRAVIEQRGLVRPKVHMISTDFHLGRLSTAMAGAGFEPATPTLFLWEGTTNYLSNAAVDATLRWCAQAAPGSLLIFTYIDADVLSHPDRYVGTRSLFASLQRAGERMTFGLSPDTLADYLSVRGLELLDDVGAATFREHYYGASARRMQGHEFYRIAHARVAGDRQVELGDATASMNMSM
jgi:methyltransferase (TIGR00027 family)